MAEEAEIDDFRRWKVDVLRDFLRQRGVPYSSRRKDELVALAFAAHTAKTPVVLSKDELARAKADDYKKLLTVSRISDPRRVTQVIPDPFTELLDKWLPEESGIHLWPPTLQIDIATYLLKHVKDQDLNQRLMSDYKEGKAYSYFDSGWLKPVFYNKISDSSNICVMKSESVPSERLHDITHKIWVAIFKQTGEVASAYYTCFAGLGSTCNHVAAVLFKIEHAWQQGLTQTSCTSLPCKWNSYGAKKKVVEPKRVCEMEWRKPHHRKKGKKPTINPPRRLDFAPSTSTSTPSQESVMSAMFSSCPQACAFQYIPARTNMCYPPEADFNVSHSVEVLTSPAVPTCLPDFAERFTSVEQLLSNIPKYTTAEVCEIENETRSQAENVTWRRQRLGRITSSLAHSVLTKVRTLTTPACKRSKNTDSLLSQLLGYVDVSENIPALKYGRSMEEEARNNYETILRTSGHKNVSVRKSGLHVHPDKVYIAASPDGLVECSCCGKGLVEIKCPLSIANSHPASANLAYLTTHEGKRYLRKNHTYYSQVQLQLGVTRRNWCDFFIYTRHGHVMSRVDFDRERWMELVDAADYFFREYVAKELVCRALRRSQSEATTH